MNLRIRYTDHKYKDDHKISLKHHVSASTGAKYRVILNLSNDEELTYHIRNERTKVYIYSSNGYTNLNVLKRAAREKLGKFGVPLGKESRDRNFGLCPAGYSQEKWEQEELYSSAEKSDTTEEL